ncbi:MAG: 50S ribosomal protein L35 [Candidatus Beckwithbacteria bacterium GW2011_GWA2_43_10]|uniref:Large ribosomal subunit protein bL35 n=1 Tax=Candidatus Beckwithbacteria bacterium GW2011_GWA2_43_10 TaxID=1618369 RepID=A0A0G1E6A6_9BACT|nr:MAG: 50S ribosomal protein L35 [Candidatus Beckwithbacteria bacterium GW2011_GWA2_43_10]
MKRKNKVIKLKSRNSVAKRFKLTGGGKIMRRGSQNRHLKANRSKKNTRRSNVPKQVTNKMAIKIKKMLGK